MAKCNRCILYMIIVAVVFYAVRPCAYANQSSRVVRVGYYDDSVENGRSGYLYDYLEEISKHTGWKYEFIKLSFVDSLEQLKNGEIDIVGGVQRTPEREAIYSFPSYSAGMTHTILVTDQKNSKYAYGDVASFDGMRVGLLRGSLTVNDLDLYCQREKFSVKKVFFDSQQAIYDSLKSGEIDAIISIMTTYRGSDMRSIAGFAHKPFYFITSKNDKALAKELEQALEKIKVQYPYFEPKLYERYFAEIEMDAPVFTKEELDYIKNSPPVKILYNKNWTPFERQNKKTGEFEGISAKIFQLISQQSGVLFEYIAEENYDNAYQLLRSGEADMICSTASDYSWASKNDIKLSRVYLEIPVLMVSDHHKGVEESMIIAMPKGLMLTERIARDYADSEIKYYNNFLECFEAIRRGEANTTFSNYYLVNEYLKDSRYANMNIVTLNKYSQQLSVGFSGNIDRKLISIIDKSLACISKEQISKFILDDTVAYKSVSAIDLLYQNPVQMAIMTLTVCMVFICLLLIIIRNKSKYNKELYQLLYVDDVTGIWSINKFRIEATKILNRRVGAYYTLLYFDINKFKVINDNYGYSVGDMTLRRIGAVLNHVLSSDDLFARIYSDHFVVLLRAQNQVLCEKRIAQLIDELSTPFVVQNNTIQVVFVVGAYSITAIDYDINLIIDSANYARGQCKVGHKSACVHYNEEFRSKLKAEKDLENDMAEALKKNEFQVYYQPKVNCNTRRIVGAEALVRWYHGSKGLLSPAVFIDLFEKNGFITQVDYFIFEQVCKQLSLWHKEGKKLFPISCNFSRLHLNNKIFAEELALIADNHGVPHEFLEIEITETIAIGDTKAVRDLLKSLKAKGFIIAIDDFGAGYSSLSILSQLAIDVIKIDRSFIYNAILSSQDQVILSGIVNIAHMMKKQLVCEGVETEEQIRLLQSIECSIIQGFYYSKPIQVEAFEEFVEAFKEKF